MGKKKQLLLEYQPTAGVNADFEQLLQNFTATETVRFEHFAEIWRDMKMSFIFAGRDSERECREYTEDIMRLALKYVQPPYNFQVRVGGLYLLYGLFHQQPLIRKVRIRLTPDIWHEITEFQAEARRQQHLDVNYIFHKLRADDAFVFAATMNQVYFNFNQATNNKDPDTAPEEFKDEQTVLYELFSDQFLQQLTQLHEHYHNVKVGLEGPDAVEPPRSLNVIQKNIVPSVYGAVMSYQHRKRCSKKTAVSDDDEDEDNIHSKSGRNIKSTLKAKAYRNVARAHRSRRHRQAVDSTDESPDKPKRNRRRKMASDSEESSSKRKRWKKRKIKTEKEIQEVAKHIENLINEQSEVGQEEAEEVGEGETIPDEFLTTPLVDEEPSTSGIQKTEGVPSTEQMEEETNDDIILHMPTFDIESEGQKSPAKKSPGGQDKSPSRKKDKNKKGKMPSVKLQPLVKKSKAVKPKKGKT